MTDARPRSLSMCMPRAGALAARFAVMAGAMAGLTACGGGSGGDEQPAGTAAQTRVHDTRVFTPNAAGLAFDALPGAKVETDRWSGVLNGAGYRIEVPKFWNGKLVMYAHGYAGTGEALNVTNPPIRRWLIEQGYAWAASSYSKNYYDVRAGLEDTNALARAFNAIAQQNGRTLPGPARVYLAGTSMGGHVAVAAVEDENIRESLNKVRYDGVTSWCGAVAPDAHQNYFAAYQLAAMQLAGIRPDSFPVTNFEAVRKTVTDANFAVFPAVNTPIGDKLYTIVQELSGGPRPIFNVGWRNVQSQNIVWTLGFSRESWNGLVNYPFQDTTGITYQLDADPAQSPEEIVFNSVIFRARADENRYNPARPDGLRWIPRVNGQIAGVPVVTLSNLGDVYVPFSLEQAYRRRADAAGRGQWLVQRTTRSTGHCEFTVAEQAAAFSAMANWAEQGVKPDGDDVLTRELIARPDYGCKYTNNSASLDDNPAVLAIRALLPACS